MQDNDRYTRLETRFLNGAQELADLALLAKSTKGNEAKLGPAVQQLIIYWSKATRGEISIQTLCEVVGIPIPQQGIPGGTAQMPFPPTQPYGYPMGMYPQVAMYPPQPSQTGPMPTMMPGYDQQGPPVPSEPEEDPAELERKRQAKARRERNRNAVANEYV